MDQLKEFWGLFRRQHFWFILPVLLVLAAYGWWTATGTVTTQVASNISKIGGFHSGADQIANVNVDGLQHPNDEWHEVMTELIEARRTNVLSAWQKKWDRQSQILTWPADAFGPRSRDVIPRVETMRPIEEFVDEDLPSVARNDYKKFMQQQLPRIANRIGAIWDPTGQFVGAGGARVSTVDAGSDMPPGFDKPIIVSWNPESQKLIQSKFDWPQYPSTMEVLYAQEDLWILGAIVDIIKTANGGARTQATAHVKEIISIKYGKDVVRNGDIDPPVAVKTGEDEDDDVLGGDGAIEPEPEPPVEGDPNGVVTRPHLAIGRYVDENFQKINSVDALKNNLDIAKRIPVQIRLRVDQRYINQLLAACANSPLTYEVRQFRFSPREEVSFTGGGSFSSHGPAPSFGGFGGPKGPTLIEPVDIDRLDREIELWGIIYIFNPVDAKMLGTGDEDAEAGPGDIAAD